jgi:putative CRISPR-associated protein (TIGR02619 family)
MSKLIITTVGTSIITNKLYEARFDTKIARLKDGISISNNEIVSSTKKNILNNLLNKSSNKLLSAEIASLKAFKEATGPGISEDDLIALFTTDTEDGKFCAEVNKVVLESTKWCKNITGPFVIEGLKTRRTEEDEDISETFKDAGLIKLKEKTEKLIRENQYSEKYFNITGGFKATIPFITILAFEKGMSLFYLYEESNDLILINPPSEFKCSFDRVVKETRIKRQILA